MKVLMFGWEFPPFISGGLGTACFGITKGLIENGVDITFVLPTKKDRNTDAPIKIIGADEIPLVGDISKFHEHQNVINLELSASISPYMTSFRNSKSFIESSSRKISKGIHGSILEFSGNYGENLLEEVMSYSLAGESIGFFEEFDIIHAHDWLTFPAGVHAKLISGKPLIIHVHATEFDRSGENINQNVYNIEKYGMENADKIITVSFYTKNLIVINDLSL